MRYRIHFFAIGLILAGTSSVQAGFMTHVDVTQTGPVFSYTVFNDEPLTSPDYVSIWHLTVDAPITVIGTPTGWDYVTDNLTYIDWFNTDPMLPYPHDVAPGDSLAGFVIQSAVTTAVLQPWTVGSWDHVQDTGGPSADGLVLSPSGSPVVPEPSSFALLGIACATFASYFGWRGRKTVAAA